MMTLEDWITLFLDNPGGTCFATLFALAAMWFVAQLLGGKSDD